MGRQRTCIRRALEGWQKVIGLLYPRTLSTLVMLVLDLKRQGKYMGVETINQELG